MKRIRISLAGLVSMLMLSGCLPEQRVIWSPDGERAAVVLEEGGGLYLCDPAGVLSEQQLDGVVRVAWRRDSQGLVVTRVKSVSSWEEAKKLLSPVVVEELTHLGESIYSTCLQTQNGPSAIQTGLSTAAVSKNQKKIISLYLKQRYPDLADPNPSEPVEVIMIQLARVKGAGIELGPVLCGASDMVWDLRVSPRDDAVAYTEGNPFEDSMPTFLYVVSMDGSAACRRVASNVALFPDWTPDGQSLVFAVSNTELDGDDLQLGSVAQCQVANEQGLLKEIPGQEDLVGVIMTPMSRVRCLPDGSIVFSALEIQLPATANDMPDYMNFFRFDPQNGVTVQRMVPRRIESYLGEWSMLFELSPDGRKLAFIDAEKRTAILTLSTGELRHVPDSDADNVLPSWRGNDELSCVCTSSEGGKTRTFVVRFSEGQDPETMELSASWPEDVLKSFSE
jgi:hypothetical protein